MKTTTSFPNELAAADDTQRALLSCILRDAREWHYAISSACADCRAAGDTCLAHWTGHQERAAQYLALTEHLERYEGLPNGRICPLTAAQQQIIAAALVEAIAYRDEKEAPEDMALDAAYRLLRRKFTPAAANAGVAVGMTA
jgi:hypothetical protein